MEHIPVSQAHFSNHQVIVGDIGKVCRPGFGFGRKKVFTGAGDGGGVVSVNVFGRMAHAVNGIQSSIICLKSFSDRVFHGVGI